MSGDNDICDFIGIKPEDYINYTEIDANNLIVDTLNSLVNNNFLLIPAILNILNTKKDKDVIDSIVYISVNSRLGIDLADWIVDRIFDFESPLSNTFLRENNIGISTALSYFSVMCWPKLRRKLIPVIKPVINLTSKLEENDRDQNDIGTFVSNLLSFFLERDTITLIKETLLPLLSILWIKTENVTDSNSADMSIYTLLYFRCIFGSINNYETWPEKHRPKDPLVSNYNLAQVTKLAKQAIISHFDDDLRQRCNPKHLEIGKQIIERFDQFVDKKFKFKNAFMLAIFPPYTDYEMTLEMNAKVITLLKYICKSNRGRLTEFENSFAVTLHNTKQQYLCHSDIKKSFLVIHYVFLNKTIVRTILEEMGSKRKNSLKKILRMSGNNDSEPKTLNKKSKSISMEDLRANISWERSKEYIVNEIKKHPGNESNLILEIIGAQKEHIQSEVETMVKKHAYNSKRISKSWTEIVPRKSRRSRKSYKHANSK